jgi:hypothetical protein
MLRYIKDLIDPLLAYIKDDPIRPEIPLDFRVSENSEIIMLMNEDKPSAIVCVTYKDFIPQDCTELMSPSNKHEVAVFYTIWSYDPGAGRKLIQNARADLPKRKPELKRFVTLSPTTEMARRFHLKNGAKVYRANIDSVNYEYD